MTDEQQNLLLMRGTIVSLPEDQQAQIQQLANQIRAIINSNKDMGTIALALVGLELQVQL